MSRMEVVGSEWTTTLWAGPAASGWSSLRHEKSTSSPLCTAHMVCTLSPTLTVRRKCRGCNRTGSAKGESEKKKKKEERKRRSESERRVNYTNFVCFVAGFNELLCVRKINRAYGRLLLVKNGGIDFRHRILRITYRKEETPTMMQQRRKNESDAICKMRSTFTKKEGYGLLGMRVVAPVHCNVFVFLVLCLSNNTIA